MMTSVEVGPFFNDPSLRKRQRSGEEENVDESVWDGRLPERAAPFSPHAAAAAAAAGPAVAGECTR